MIRMRRAGAAVQGPQEAVEPVHGNPRPPIARKQAGGVLRNQPGVLGGVALGEAGAVEVVVARGEGPIFEAGLDLTAARVEQIAPVS